jgi:hypothetical protein
MIFEYVLDIKKLFLVMSMVDIAGSIETLQSLMFVWWLFAFEASV